MEMCSRMIFSGPVKFSLLSAVLFSTVLSWATLPSAAQSTGLQQARLEFSQPQQALQEGRQLEKQRLWSEALSLYQQALKKFPHEQSLKRRRDIARIHFDLDRRYSDTSFLRTIKSTGANKALNVYAEVLSKIQSYYVDEPNWTQVAAYGFTSLEIALGSQDFRKANVPAASDADVQAALRKTRKSLEHYTAENRHDAYVFASTAASLLHRQLGLPIQSSIYEFVCGAISALDPYSAFMSGNQYSETMSQIEGNFVGLGVELRTHSHELEIVSVIPGGPAGSAGLDAGDRIVAVNNRQVKEIGSERAADLLRGIEGSYVEIDVHRGELAKKLKLQRRRVEIPSVDKVTIVDRQFGIGYIGLTNFQKTTARDFDEALWKLHRAGMRSLIVDVRGNPGGLLSASVDIADRFLSSGVIVSTRGRNPLEDYTHRAQANSTWRVPLIVLVDENSASASEIFAAAIKDHKRGTIVGEQSYGKGSVQGIFPLNASGGGVRLTTAKFYSPSGQAISQSGVTPHVVPQRVARADRSGELDEQDIGLRASIQVARRALANREKTDRAAVAGRR